MASGIGLSVRSNHEQVFAEMDREVAAIRAVAMPRALNKLRDQAKVAGLRVVADLYGIGPRTFEKYVTLKLATTADTEAVITVKGKGLPMYLFKPRPSQPGKGRKGGGVAVLIKGRTLFLEGAFIARMKSGHVGIFARGAYGGKGKRFHATGGGFGRFLYSSTRLSINEFYTFGAPDALASKQATEAMTDRIDAQADSVIRAEIRFAVH